MLKEVLATCKHCQKEFVQPILLHKDGRPRQGNRKTCGMECQNKIRSLTVANTNRIYASERMTLNNPMKTIESQNKMKATLKGMKHKPPIRGGNGKELPIPQKMLLQALGDGWNAEYVVTTKDKNIYEIKRLPNHYKIDIANPILMIAIEVDGFSHQSLERKFQDEKKDAFLTGAGWEVLRFTNEDVLSDLGSCLNKIKYR